MFGICFLIAEILLFISGVWAMISGKVPAIVFGKKYRIEGWGARIIGLIIALPFAAVLFAILLTAVAGEETGQYAAGVSGCLFFVALIAAFIVSRIVRQPVDDI